jgi:hypothetical protein
MVNHKLRALNVPDKPNEDVFAIDTVLIMLSNNENSHNEVGVDLGEWGENYKLYSYDGFAYALNENYIHYITYPLVRNLNKDERREVLNYRFGEEGSRDKRKPRYGDVCLYYGRITATKPNKAGKAPYQVTECNREAVMTRIDNETLVAISSLSGEIAYVPKDLSEDMLNALQSKSPRGM